MKVPKDDKHTYCWDEFKNYCSLNGIQLDNDEDYREWWACWKEAIKTKLSDIQFRTGHKFGDY